MDAATGAALEGLTQRYGRSFEAGAFVYRQGAATGAFFVIVRGRVVLEATNEAGERTPVHLAVPGGTIGLVSAFAGTPAETDARVLETAQILIVPFERAADVFAAAPEVAVLALLGFARNGAEPHQPPTAEELQSLVEGATTERSGSGAVVRIEYPYDAAAFYTTEFECPVSGTRFDQLRTRAGRLRPAERESDFHVLYGPVDPTHYAMIVCPGCGFAAYSDDFEDLSDRENVAVRRLHSRRGAYTDGNLCGGRSPAQAMRSIELALAAYQARGADSRRLAGLLHRMAWLSRDAGDVDAELRLLSSACDRYIDAYERDKDLTESTAARAAYLIGDLKLRLDEPNEAFAWLSSCLKIPTIEEHAGLARMARERMRDARSKLESLGRAA